MYTELPESELFTPDELTEATINFIDFCTQGYSSLARKLVREIKYIETGIHQKNIREVFSSDGQNLISIDLSQVTSDRRAICVQASDKSVPLVKQFDALRVEQELLHSKLVSLVNVITNELQAEVRAFNYLGSILLGERYSFEPAYITAAEDALRKHSLTIEIVNSRLLKQSIMKAAI